MERFPRIEITEEMLIEARKLERSIEVHRTKASSIDTITGALGEFVFAQWFSDDWRMHEVGANKGDVDFQGLVEIKTSSFPFRDTLNLLVREDYASKRHPPYYVQVIIDVASPKATEITAGTSAVLAGYATDSEVEVAPLRDMGSKYGGRGGYRCHHIIIRNLHPMRDFRGALDKYLNERAK